MLAELNCLKVTDGPFPGMIREERLKIEEKYPETACEAAVPMERLDAVVSGRSGTGP